MDLQHDSCHNSLTCRLSRTVGTDNTCVMLYLSGTAKSSHNMHRCAASQNLHLVRWKPWHHKTKELSTMKKSLSHYLQYSLCLAH